MRIPLLSPIYSTFSYGVDKAVSMGGSYVFRGILRLFLDLLLFTRVIFSEMIYEKWGTVKGDLVLLASLDLSLTSQSILKSGQKI